MNHDPSTCPYCDDSRVGRPLVTPTSAFEVHLTGRIHELEDRIQELEWRNHPLGPNPNSELSQQEKHALDKQLFRALKKVLDDHIPMNAPKSPAYMTAEQAKAECEQCFEEFGSLACLRPAHGNIPTHKHVFVPPSNDDEQQCDTDCRQNWHKCSICGKTRSELGLKLVG